MKISTDDLEVTQDEQCASLHWLHDTKNCLCHLHEYFSDKPHAKTFGKTFSIKSWRSFF